MRFLKKNYMVIVMSIFLMFGSTMVAEAAKVSFAEKTYTIKVGQRINLTDELTEEVEIVKWKTTDKTIAKVNQRGKVVGIRKGIVRVTAVTEDGMKIMCKVRVTAKRKSSGSGSDDSGDDYSIRCHSGSGDSSGGDTVYWTPSGSVYHYSRSCPTLSRSRTVYEGTVAESHKSHGCKVCG
jgi:hypothetical protein